MFVDRENELESLEDEWEKTNSFTVIYGRRRIGKTSLIKQFIKEKKHVYYLATELPIDLQFDDLQLQAGRELDDDLLKNQPFDRWEDFFNYITKHEFILIIDEFPYLIEAEKAIPSIFQKGWDEYLKDSNIHFILCGSSISMMEDNILKSDSPLYGRKTSQVKLKELPIKSLKCFLPDHRPNEIIGYYSIYGGVPAYLETLDPKFNLEKNLEETVLNIDAPLKDAVDFILKSELRKPERYRAILTHLSRGVTTMNGLSQEMDMPGNRISQYLAKLRNLRLVEREEPVTLSSTKNKRRGRYFIKDKFFRFFFQYILPNRSDLEEGRKESVLNDFKSTENSYVAPVFENICQNYVLKTMDYQKVGRWWYKEEEIDVVGLNEKSAKMLLGECKWSKNPVGKEIYHRLREKENKVRWHEDEREVEYAIFSRSGFTQGLTRIDEEGLSLIDLDQLWKGL